MNFNIYQYIHSKIKDDKEFLSLCQELNVAAKTVLLQSDRISQNFYYIKSGCLRLFLNQDGKDITFQFFFEGQSVTSIESFIYNTPSMFSIEAIEPTTILVSKKSDLFKLIEKVPTLKDELNDLIMQRLVNYTHLFLSRIKDTPEQRYKNLIKEYPQIIKRVPQHYIASYLGITSVSLSRIRNRK